MLIHFLDEPPKPPIVRAKLFPAVEHHTDGQHHHSGSVGSDAVRSAQKKPQNRISFTNSQPLEDYKKVQLPTSSSAARDPAIDQYGQQCVYNPKSIALPLRRDASTTSRSKQHQQRGDENSDEVVAFDEVPGK